MDDRALHPAPSPFNPVQLRAGGREEEQGERLAMRVEKWLNALGMVDLRLSQIMTMRSPG